jgi:hypothetical protein
MGSCFGGRMEGKERGGTGGKRKGGEEEGK